jgi:O-methyltransferase
MLKYIIKLKEFLLYSQLLTILKPCSNLFHTLYYFNRLTTFVNQHKNGLLMNDFYVSKRDYNKRYKMYDVVSLAHKKNTEQVMYLEFGVASALSFKWWLNHNTNTNSKFFGFDTFEGLPENWGKFYVKGDLAHGVPNIDDKRAMFLKGLFQDTLPGFIEQHKAELQQPKIIHLDADLYSATLFVLTQLYPYLKKGDLIFFDEFSVPTHEFKAFDEFTQTCYVKLKPIAAVNNFYQTAFVVE